MSHLPSTVRDRLHALLMVQDHASPEVTAVCVMEKVVSREEAAQRGLCICSVLGETPVSHLTVPTLDDGSMNTWSFLLI